MKLVMYRFSRILLCCILVVSGAASGQEQWFEPARNWYRCTHNLDKISLALSSYRADHNGANPKALTELTPKYLDSLPHCPGNAATRYEFQTNGEQLVLFCAGSNHLRAGLGPDHPRLASGEQLDAWPSGDPRVPDTVRRYRHHGELRGCVLNLKLLGSMTQGIRPEELADPRRKAALSEAFGEFRCPAAENSTYRSSTTEESGFTFYCAGENHQSLGLIADQPSVSGPNFWPKGVQYFFRELELTARKLPDVRGSMHRKAGQATLVSPELHTGRISAIDWSPGRDALASIEIDDRVLKIWHPSSGRLLRTFRPNDGNAEDSFLSLAWNPKSEEVAVGDYAGTIHIWNTRTGKYRTFRASGNRAADLDWSPDGQLLLVSAETSWILLRPREGEPNIRKGPSLESSVHAVGFASEGNRFCTAGAGGLRVWDAASGAMVNGPFLPDLGEELAYAYPSGSKRLLWSPDGRFIAVLGDEVCKMVDLASTVPKVLEMEHPLVHDPKIYAGSWSPNGQFFAYGAEGGIRVLKRSGSRFREYAWDYRYRDDFRTLDWSPDGNTLAYAVKSGIYCNKIHENPRRDNFSDTYGELETFLETSRLLHEFLPSSTFSLDWQNDTLVGGGSNGGLRLWDLERGGLSLLTSRLRADSESHWTRLTRGISLSPVDQRLASARDDRTVRIWDLEVGRMARTIDVDYRPTAVSWAPDGQTLAVGFPAVGVSLFGADGAVVGKLPNHGASGWSRTFPIEWKPDGTMLAGGGPDEAVRVWDAGNGRLKDSLWCSSPVLSLDWDPSHTRIAVGCQDGTVFIHDAGKGEVLDRMVLHDGSIVALDWHPETNRIVTASTDGTAKIWNEDGVLATLTTSGEFKAARWSPDGQILVTSGVDKLEFWSSDGEPLATALPFSDGDWLVATPEGFFDTGATAYRSFLWRFGDTYDVGGAELFYSEFYQPGVLAEILRERKPISAILAERGDPRAALDIAKKDRRQPSLALTVSPIAGDVANISLKIESAPNGARDARLFRNGTMVHLWEGKLKVGTLDVTIPISPGSNNFSAYAFSDSNIKSADALTLLEAPADVSVSKVAHLLLVGVDKYEERKDLALSFAAADAQALGEKLAQTLPVETVETTLLVNEKATRQAVLEAIEQIAEKAGPEDTVIVFFAGHGVLGDDGSFHLIPHDIAGRAEFSKLTGIAISDRDLERALRPLQAENIALILDSCHSGAALDSEEMRRGPMNSRGLAQLAWEKGMDIITASQSNQFAQEALSIDGRKIGHGLLTYCLLSGLEPGSDGLLARDWMDTAAQTVPSLVQGQALGTRVFELSGGDSGYHVQQPRVFRRRGGGSWPVRAEAEGSERGDT